MTIYSDLIYELEQYGVPSWRAMQIAAEFTRAGGATVGWRNPRIEAMERRSVVAPCTCKTTASVDAASRDQCSQTRVVPMREQK